MIEYFLWIVSLLGLYIGVFWTQVAFMDDKETSKKKINWPLVSFIVPAWNEESTLRKTIESLVKLDYPKKQIIIVNDGSTDSTEEIAKALIREYKDIELINRKRSPEQFTKAPALNVGLKHAKGEYVACLDSDSTVEPDSLKKLLPLFEDNTAAVISAIKVSNPRTVFAKIQRIEYILATFVRTLMSRIDTLHITPGALSVYKTSVIKKLGGFDEENITEDYEIAMRLRYNGYTLKMQPQSISYTAVPETFKGLWDQRVRWFRGFIMTSLKYKKMFGNRKLGMMGVFQYPLNIITFSVIIIGFTLFTYEWSTSIYTIGKKLWILGLGVFDIIKTPSFTDVLMKTNIKIIFPIIISLGVGLYIYYLAHKAMKEKLRFPLAFIIYLFLYPPLRTMHWITAVYKETFRRKRKW
ncbi:MAG: glycosyltransferase family 2 protein [Candidatus Woesearchaeota archaeon]